MTGLWPWVIFNGLVLAILAIDLGLFNKKAHVVSVKEAAIWSLVWVTVALLFAGAIFVLKGSQAGTEFLTGYLIEYSLSVDNIFVIVLIFAFFGVKEALQHRVLFWGIIGALCMRGAMIAAGTLLLTRFHWITYIFGAFLIVTGIRMCFQDDADIDPDANPVIRLVRKVIPVCSQYDGEKFFVEAPDERGRRRTMATPLFIVLALIETMDLVFAVDSIPAVFAVTHDPFIVYTSNVSAILGLRSLYFLLANVIHKFHYLRYGLAVVLAFVGVKMLAAIKYVIPTLVSLGVIVIVLAASVVVSLLVPHQSERSASNG